MGRRGKGYGSEDHLLRYREQRVEMLNSHVRAALKTEADVYWLYPGQGREEPTDLSFMPLTPEQHQKWAEFWPQPGNRRWDAIALSRGEWLLVEAKANAFELCSSPCGATAASLEKITRAFNEVKSFLGISTSAKWHGVYYQYANRIAALYFLNVVLGIPARLLFLYFIGDHFPDGRHCPKTAAEWSPLIAKCHDALSLPQNHRLASRIHRVFIPAYQAEASGL